jgi:hypothetical protein
VFFLSHDVFISYASQNKQTADAVCHVLEANKIKCWIAPRNVSGGIPYAREINKAINDSDVFVLVFSEFAQKSRFVSSEIDLAFKNNKPILSFNIDGTLPEDEMEFYLSACHWLDAYPEPEVVFKKLIKDTFNLLQKSVTDENSESKIVEVLDSGVVKDSESKIVNNENKFLSNIISKIGVMNKKTLVIFAIVILITVIGIVSWYNLQPMDISVNNTNNSNNTVNNTTQYNNDPTESQNNRPDTSNSRPDTSNNKRDKTDNKRDKLDPIRDLPWDPEF